MDPKLDSLMRLLETHYRIVAESICSIREYDPPRYEPPATPPASEPSSAPTAGPASLAYESPIVKADSPREPSIRLARIGGSSSSGAAGPASTESASPTSSTPPSTSESLTPSGPSTEAGDTGQDVLVEARNFAPDFDVHEHTWNEIVLHYFRKVPKEEPHG